MRGPNSTRFALALACAYALVAGLGVLRHEMWRDELEVLATIRDNSLVTAIAGLADTNLYFYALFAWVKLWAGSAAAFQAYHLAAATAAVWVLARHAPFGRVQKALFAFGYFPLFEYGIISRDYSFATLLLFVALALVASPRRRYVAAAVALLLLGNHGLFAAFAAGGLAAYAALDVWERSRRGAFAPAERRRLAVALGVLAIGALLLGAQYYLLAKTRGSQFVDVAPAAPSATVRAVWNAYVPLPEFANPHFWNTNLVHFEPVPIPDVPQPWTAEHTFAVVASLLLLLGACLVLADRAGALAAYVVPTLAGLLFLHYLSVQYVRYVGYLYLALVAAVWLGRVASPAARIPGLDRLRRVAASRLAAFVRGHLAAPLFTALLIAQLVAGAFAWSKDVALPFTASGAAAQFIRERGLAGRTTLGMVDYVTAPVAIRLGQQFYFPESRSFRSYVDWRAGTGRQELISFNAVLADAIGIARAQEEPLLLVLSFEIKALDGGPLQSLEVEPGIVLHRLAGFPPGIVPDEYYFLYELRRS